MYNLAKRCGMKINFLANCDYSCGSDTRNLLRRYLRQVIKLVNSGSDIELTVNFVDAKEIRRLNREMRSVDKVTDVLSFPAYDIVHNNDGVVFDFCDSGTIYLGDMAICVVRAEEQAKEYGETLEEEIARLFVHSVLHLYGYDHIDDEDYKEMHALEKAILKDKCID